LLSDEFDWVDAGGAGGGFVRIVANDFEVGVEACR
jgi:hypothetical protein